MSMTLEQQRALAIARSRLRAGSAPQQRKSGVVETIAGGMANINRGLGIGDEIAALGGTVSALATGRRSGNPVNVFKAELADQRALEDQFATERPRVAALARGTGMAATAAIPVGGQARLFAEGGRVANAARGATLAGGQAALYAAADRGTASERLSAASRAARDPLTLAVGAAGGALATTPRPKKFKRVDPDVELLAREGVRMTPGQMRGGIGRAAEDAGTSQPILGQAITERRIEGFEDFNRALANRALRQIGEELPENVPAGSAAVKYVGDKLSAGYEAAIPNVVVRADPGYADDVRRVVDGLETITPDSFQRLSDILDQRVTSRIPQNGAIDGALYKKIQSELDWEVARYKGAGDPDQRAIGEAIEGVQKALEGAARRQDPRFAAQIDGLDRGWAELARIESAAAKSVDLSGIATPKQYAQSVKMGDGRVRRRGVARGEALSQDLAGAAVRVLPSQMPDSGTAGRGAWGMVTAAPGAAVGALAGGAPGALAGIAGTAATLKGASTFYSPQAIQAANVALAARIGSQGQREALAELADMAARDPAVIQLYREVAARLSAGAGVQGGAAAYEAPPNIFAQP